MQQQQQLRQQQYQRQQQQLHQQQQNGEIQIISGKTVKIIIVICFFIVFYVWP